MRYQFTFIPIIIITFVLSIPVCAQNVKKTPCTIEELKKEIETIIQEHAIPGIALALVSKDDILWVGGIGKSDVALDKEVTAETIFRWGSVSKSLISIAILMLAEQRLMSLEDNIRDIVPEIEFKNHWEATHPVKIVHCLEHTTGFDDMHFKELAMDDPHISILDALSINPNPRCSRWQPGTYMAYNNVAPSIAAYVVEKLTGQSFETFAQEQIFVPLGMSTATFFYPEQKELMSKGYAEDGLTEVKYDHIFVRPSGSLNASAQDMAYFVQMLLNQGSLHDHQLLQPQSVKRMEMPTTTLAARAGFPYGYGLANHTMIKHGVVFHGHLGGIPGFLACYGYNADLGLGYAFSINAPQSEWERIDDLITSYLTSGVDTSPPKAVTIPQKSLRSFTGYYQGMASGSHLLQALVFRFLNLRRLSMQDGTLFSGNYLLGSKWELVPESKNIFYRKERPDVRLFLFKDYEDYHMVYADIRKGSYRRVSGFQAYFQLGLAVLSLLLMITSPLFALIWIPRKLLGRMKQVRYLRARLFPLLAVLFFSATYFLLFGALLAMEMDERLMVEFGTFSLRSFSLFLASICFAISSFLGLFFSIRAFSIKMNRFARIHSLLVSLANVTVVIYLLYSGVIGIMTWAY